MNTLRTATSSIFHRAESVWLLALFFMIRIGSFLLRNHTILQGLLAFSLVMLLAGLYFKNPKYAWYLVIGEIFLGGAGHFLELGGIAIRTLFILTFFALWTLHALSTKTYHWRLHIPHRVYYPLIPLGIIVAAASVHGLLAGNGMHAVFADAVPYLFLLLLFPAYHLLQEEESQHMFIRLLIIFIIGNALFALGNFILFSGEIAVLHNPYYNWFRDVVMGKITNMGHGFFRIVTPSHVLIPPITLVITGLLMRDEKHHYLWRVLLGLCALILVLNLSRAFFLGLMLATPVLLYRHTIQQWLKESLTLAGILIALFIGINLVASGGSSLGLDLFTDRAVSFTNPASEQSTYTRMELLPAIVTIIRAHPFLGIGLGGTVTFQNPVTYDSVTTSQFDWGFLELWAELGILGIISFLAVFVFLCYEILYHIRVVHDHRHLYIGLLAGTLSLLIITIFSPALFHVFGMLYTGLLIALAAHHPSISEKIGTLLCKVFHKEIIG